MWHIYPFTQCQWSNPERYIDDLTQDCNYSIANALALLQPFAKPSIRQMKYLNHNNTK